MSTAATIAGRDKSIYKTPNVYMHTSVCVCVRVCAVCVSVRTHGIDGNNQKEEAFDSSSLSLNYFC